jgi:hypothetical protein
MGSGRCQSRNKIFEVLIEGGRATHPLQPPPDSLDTPGRLSRTYRTKSREERHGGLISGSPTANGRSRPRARYRAFWAIRQAGLELAHC